MSCCVNWPDVEDDPTPGVATPQIRPFHTIFDDSLEVSITCDTPGAEIWYTLDGSTPGRNNPGSQRYQKPLTITRTTLVQAIAYRDGYKMSLPSQRTYARVHRLYQVEPEPERV